MKTLNREGKKKRELRNLMRRGRVWYFKKMVDGRTKPVSLGTEDMELAKAKRNQLEQSAIDEEWDKVKGVRNTAGSLEEVCKRYREIGGLTHKAIGANISSLLCLVRTAMGNEDLEPADIKLSVLTKKLVRDYQDKMRARYEAEAVASAGDGGRANVEKSKRVARDRADRTSKSTFNQAKCVFALKRDLIERYRESGIDVPDSVKEFCEAGAVGKMSTKLYFPPSDAQMKTTFERVEDLRSSDPEAYNLFWTALATGCRRNELADMLVKDIVELDGRLWVGAGLGKDGEAIRIPLITWPVHAANPRTPASVVAEMIAARKEPNAHLFLGDKTERYDEMPDRLNSWLSRQGWTDEKKLHGLRSYIGCKLYVKNPRLAQLYLRHKSIATTEKFYAGFLRLSDAFKFELDAVPAPGAPTPAGPVLTVLPAA